MLLLDELRQSIRGLKMEKEILSRGISKDSSDYEESKKELLVAKSMVCQNIKKSRVVSQYMKEKNIPSLIDMDCEDFASWFKLLAPSRSLHLGTSLEEISDTKAILHIGDGVKGLKSPSAPRLHANFYETSTRSYCGSPIEGQRAIWEWNGNFYEKLSSYGIDDALVCRDCMQHIL